MSTEIKSQNPSVHLNLAKRVDDLEEKSLTNIEKFCHCVDTLAYDLEMADCFEQHNLQMHKILDRIDEYIVCWEKENSRKQDIPLPYPFNLKDEEIEELLSQLTN